MSFVFKLNNIDTHCFLHIPKNGGSSLTETLKHYNPFYPDGWNGERPNPAFCGHHTYMESANLFNNPYPFSLNCGSVKYFCITRNPWDRMVSYYSYIRDTDPNLSGLHDYHKLLNEGLSFSSFVHSVVLDGRKVLRPQFHYIVDRMDEVVVHDMLKLENIQDDLDRFLQRQNLPPIEMVKINTSNHNKYKDYYEDSHLIDMVGDFENGIINHMGYQF